MIDAWNILGLALCTVLAVITLTMVIGWSLENEAASDEPLDAADIASPSEGARSMRPITR